MPFLVVSDSTFKPDHGIRVRCEAIPNKHFGFVDRFTRLVVCFPSRISKAALFGFVFHRTIAWRMDVDRGFLIAFGTGGSGENEIRKFLGCANLTDDLHVVERGLELRPITEAQDSRHVSRCRSLVANLLRGCRTEREGDEEERPNSHD